MGRGAHAAHAAYNGSGTQGISVTNEINKDEEIHSVFITENDTTKQILHGHNISEMTCSGKLESVTSERYKIFTPVENDDMLGDIYLNFEMDSEITDFTFVDTSIGGQEINLQNVEQEDISKNFSFGGEDYNLMTIDYSNNSLPIVNSTTKSDVSYINKTLNVTYDNVNYEIVVGKGTSNIAVRILPGSSWSNHDISNFSEIIDIIMINVDGKDLFIVGGRPATTTSPYKVLELQNSNGTISITQSDLVVTNNNLTKEFNIIVKLFYEDDKLIMSGFKYHDNEVLRAPDSYFHTDDVNYQTTFIITGLSWNNTESVLTANSINGLTFTPERDTVSKRLESYNYRDCIVSSSIKYDDTNYAYITGTKEKVLLALSPNQDNNNEIKRSYDNGLNWEDVDIYQTSDNYYPMSTLYKKNETLVHTQLNKFGFLVDNLTSYTIDRLKTFIVDTYGYIKSDIKVINKRTKMEYDDNLTMDYIKTLDSVQGTRIVYNSDNSPDTTSATEYDLSSCLDIRIKNSPNINDYEHIWVNIKINNNNFKKIWTIGQNIKMTSKKPYGAITRIIVTNGGTGYSSSPNVIINPNEIGGTPAVLNAVLTDGILTSIDIQSGGSGYDGTEAVIISGSGGLGATAIIDKYSIYKKYLTLGEFKQNISDMLKLTTSDYNLKFYYTVNNKTFTGNNNDNDDKSVFELGLLQIKKIDILATDEYDDSQVGNMNFIRLGGQPQNAEFKPVDERLNDKFKIHFVVKKDDTTVIHLKNRLVEIYGGQNTDYLICKKDTKLQDSNPDNLYNDNASVYGGDIIPATTSNNSIIDTYNNHNLELRFADTHPILQLSDPKIVYVSIPLFLGNDSIKRRTVSLLANDSNNPTNYITLEQLKNKIIKLLDPLYTKLIGSGDYYVSLVKGGSYSGQFDFSDKNLWASVGGLLIYNDSLKLDDETLGIKSGDILYFYYGYKEDPYMRPKTEQMANYINISLSTDPLYSEKIISTLGVMDDLKYYIPNVNVLVNNDKGLWVAAGTPGDPDFSITGLDYSSNPIEEALKRPKLFVFVSNNDGYNWHPVKFSVIKNNTLGISYKDADIEHYDDPKYKIEYVSGYVSNSRGDIRITFNIYDTSIDVIPGASTEGNELGKPVTSCILDIDHYKICPDVISNYSLKAIKMSHIIDNIPPNCPLTYAISIRNEFDMYIFYNINPHVWSTVENRRISTDLTVQTINSDIIYTYNEKIKISGVLTETIYDFNNEILYYDSPRYKRLDSYLIKTTVAWTRYGTVRTQLFRQTYVGGNSEIIKIGGETYIDNPFVTKLIIETDFNKKAVLLYENYTRRSDIYTYDDINLNFNKVAALQYLCKNVNFLENVWIISGSNKLLISYDTVHWREIDTSITINELFSKNNRYHDTILTYDAEKSALKPKRLKNFLDRYKGISLFHDISIRGGIKVNIDEELVADRTNYIIDCYSIRDEIDGTPIYVNNGVPYKPNDIIRVGNIYIICGNNSGLTNNSNESLSLIESDSNQFNSDISNTDDIVFFESRSLYSEFRGYNTLSVKDFMNNFNMERFYIDTNISRDNVYCSGSYTDINGKKYGILAIRSIPLKQERSRGHALYTYFWKLLYAPSLSDVPIDSYEIETDYPNNIRAPWKDTTFEKINDLVFADNKVVIVGKGRNGFNLCYSSIQYPEWFGLYSSNDIENQVNLNFQEIHTVCFYKGYWFVGGKPIYETINGSPIKNNYCLAYTSNILGDWTYKDFPLQENNSSLYEVNNMETIDINGNKCILTNISYIKKDNNIDNLVMAVLFINIDFIGNLSFVNCVQFNTLGINETKTSSRTWNDFPLQGDGFDREKWLNRPFNLEIEGINRNIISTIHCPKTKDMYYVEYNSNLGFILIPYSDTFIPIIDKSEFGEYPKFIKHIKLGSETLTNKTRGHCYKMAKVTNENFITGLNSARYVAVGKGALSPISYSDDFENWVYSDAGNVFDIVFDVAHTHGIWIAVGEGNYNIGISKDGKTWTGIYPIEERENLITTTYDSTLNSLSFSTDTKITDVLPYIPELKGIFLRNLSILRLFSRVEYHVGTQIWQTLTFDDIKAMLDTEFGAGEYNNLLKNCSIINKNGSTRLTTWIPGFTKTLNSKLETFANVSESGSFPSGLLKEQKLSIKIYYNKLENVIGDTLESSDMNNAVFDNFMNNTLIPTDRDTNYYIDSFLADNYGFQLGDIYQNINGYFKLKFSTEIQRLRLYCKKFELDEIEIEEFNKGIKQNPKITQSLYFDADNVGYLLLDLDSFNLYASHIIVSGWLTSGVHITDMNLELNGNTYQKVIELSVIDYATKSYLGLNYNRYTFNGVDKEDGTGSLVIPLASTAYSGSSVPLDRYSSIRLRINFNELAGPKSYINVTCVGTTTVSYNNSVANIDLY